MEKWQKEYLTANLPLLLDNTFCTPTLLTRLEACKILSSEEKQKILFAEDQATQNSLLYQISKTRTDGYNKLISALYKHNQTGAVKILLKGYEYKGFNAFTRIELFDNAESLLKLSININGKTHKFEELCRSPNHKELLMAMKSKMRVDEFFELFNGSDTPLTLLDNEIPLKRQYYLERKIFQRNVLNKRVLQHECSDIFVIKNIGQSKLSEMSGKFTTSTSSAQIKKLTSRFIILQDEDHFKDIVELSKAPVHLIKFYTDSETLTLEKSVGDLCNIEAFIKEEKTTYSEAQFLSKIIQTDTSEFAMIRGTSGIGKSQLLTSLATASTQHSSNPIVFYVDLSSFLQNSKSFPLLTDYIDLVVQFSSLIGFKKFLLEQILRHTHQKIVIFIEELNYYSFLRAGSIDNSMTAVLRSISAFEQRIKFILTCTFRRENDAAQHFSAQTFEIMPLTYGEQIELLSNLWRQECLNQNKQHEKPAIKNFAQEVLKLLNLKVSSKELELAGIPLQCYMLSEIYKKDALRLTSLSSSVGLLKDSVLIETIPELFRQFMASKFTVCSQKEKTKQHHQYVAINTLFPNFLQVFINHENLKLDLSLLELLKIGILEESRRHTKTSVPDLNSLRFYHSSFAEYIVAEYFFNKLTVYPNTKHFNNYYHREILNCVYNHVFHMRKNCDFQNHQKSAFQSIVQGIPRHFETLNLQVYHFCESDTVLFFLNFFLCNAAGSKSAKLFKPIFKIVELEKFCQILMSCLQQNYEGVFDFHKSAIEHAGDVMQDECWAADSETGMPLMFVGAAFSRYSLFVSCYELWKEYMKFDLLESCQWFSKTQLMPLHLALRTGNYEVCEFLLKRYKYDLKDRGLFHICLKASNLNSLEIIQSKVQLIQYLHSKSRALLNEKWMGKTPILVRDIHVILLKCMVNLGADLFASDKDMDTLLYVAVKYKSHVQYHEILEYLLSLDIGSDLCSIKHPKGRTLYNEVMRVKQLKVRTLELFSWLPINDKDTDNENAFFAAVRNKQSGEVLEYLLHNKADLSVANKNNENILDVLSNDWKNQHVIEFLLQHQSENVPRKANISENTLLHLVAMKLPPAFFHKEVQNCIKQRNFDLLNAKNSTGFTPLQLAVCVSDGETKAETLKLIFESGNGDIESEDDKGNTILFMAVKRNRSLGLIKTLVSLNANCHHKNNKGQNVLHLAVKRQDVQLVEYFLDKSVDLTEYDIKQKTPAHIAQRLLLTYQDKRAKVYANIMQDMIEILKKKTRE